MKPDKHKQKEKRIIWLKKRWDDLWKHTRSRYYFDYNDDDWVPLENPIRHGYWAEWIPIGKFLGTEESKFIQAAINVCSERTWSSNKNFTKKGLKGQVLSTLPTFTKARSWRAYQELPYGAKKYFYKDYKQSSWGGWFDYYFLKPEFKTRVQIKYSRAYITHTKVPNTEKQKEFDEIEKELYALTDDKPWGSRGHSKWDKATYAKLKSKVRAKTTKLIKIALNTKDYDVLDELSNSNKPYKYWS